MIAFVIGFFLGGMVGGFVISLCMAAGDRDLRSGYQAKPREDSGRKTPPSGGSNVRKGR